MFGFQFEITGERPVSAGWFNLSPAKENSCDSPRRSPHGWLCLRRRRLALPATCNGGARSWTTCFVSEGVAAADFNHDGKVDVVAGDVWYEAPEWNMHELRPVGKYQFDKGYSLSFADFTADVNGDGWDDVIVVGFPGAPFNWYENPQNKPGHWKEHVIWHSACNESPEFEDVDRRRQAGNHPRLAARVEIRVTCDLPDKAKRDTRSGTSTPISAAGRPGKNGTHKFYHGLGVGDLNGDGRTDVLIPHGWWEAPARLTVGEWKFHPFTLSADGKGDSLHAANMYVEDLDLDGDNDIIMSSAHSYGVWWFENQSNGDEQKFAYHLIDKSLLANARHGIRRHQRRRPARHRHRQAVLRPQWAATPANSSRS